MDHRAARRQRRPDLARQHRQREVPRGDRRADADGFTIGEQPAARNRGGNNLAQGAGRFLGIELQEAGAVIEFAPGLLQRLAVLQRNQPGDVLAMDLQQFPPAAQHLAAFLRRLGRPRRTGVAGGGDRPLGLVRAQIRHFAERLARERIVHFDRRAAAADPLAVYERFRKQQVGFVERAARGNGHQSSPRSGLVIGAPPSNKCSKRRKVHSHRSSRRTYLSVTSEIVIGGWVGSIFTPFAA